MSKGKVDTSFPFYNDETTTIIVKKERKILIKKRKMKKKSKVKKKMARQFFLTRAGTRIKHLILSGLSNDTFLTQYVYNKHTKFRF